MCARLQNPKDEDHKSPVMLMTSVKKRLQTYGTKLDSWEVIIVRLMDVADKAQQLADAKCPKCGTPVVKGGN